MPQTGDGDDIERSGGRRRLSALEARLASIEEAIDARIDAGRRPTGAQQRNLASAQEALRAAEAAEEAAEAAEEAAPAAAPAPARTLSRGQKISIGARTNNWARREIGTANYADMSRTDKQRYTKFRNRLTREELARD